MTILTLGRGLQNRLKYPIRYLMNFQVYLQQAKTRAAGSDGKPVWVNVPAPSNDELVSIAETKRSILLSVAKDTISVWQSELLLGNISDEDKASLTLWIS